LEAEGKKGSSDRTKEQIGSNQYDRGELGLAKNQPKLV
jgi:hypothetical protein